LSRTSSPQLVIRHNVDAREQAQDSRILDLTQPQTALQRT
jgi:hypothetical protein